MEILVDSSVILDILTEDGSWFAWSSGTLADCASSNILAVNPIIYAEVSIRFEKVEELDAALPSTYFRRLPLPWEAAFLAGVIAALIPSQPPRARRLPLPPVL